jgi:hypothetical protein
MNVQTRKGIPSLVMVARESSWKVRSQNTKKRRKGSRSRRRRRLTSSVEKLADGMRRGRTVAMAGEEAREEEEAEAEAEEESIRRRAKREIVL